MRRFATLCASALLVCVVAGSTAHGQAANDADNVIMRLRSVCNGGQGSTLIIAFEIKARTGLSPRNVGGYNIVLTYNNQKMTLQGIQQRYQAQYWPGAPAFRSIAYGPAGWYNQHYRGNGSALPLNNQYWEDAKDCAGNTLNDGFFEVLRYQFQILSSANGTANFSMFDILPYRAGIQYQPGLETSAIYYANLMNNSNDSAQVIVGLVVPVQLATFTAAARPDGAVDLAWATEAETSNFGFEIERGDGDGYRKIGFVPGQGTVTRRTEYTFVDAGARDAASGGVVTYRLKQIDTDGTTSYSQVVAVAMAPASVGLEQNFPNPVQVGGSTTIPYALAVPASVSLSVYNALGQRVATISDAEQHASGRYQATWNGRTLSGDPAPAGVYYIRFAAEIGGERVTQSRQISIIR